MSNKTILVTGGAGYIGSHVVKLLGQAGERVVTLDNLYTGFKDAVLYGDIIEGDIGDQKLVSQILNEYDVDSVIHFAAHTIVPESVENPLKYYGNNTCKSRNLMECCRDAGVKHFIFSSTAAVYGVPDTMMANEDTSLLPISAYGRSKLMTEWMLQDLSKSSNLKNVVLRYFNVAGSDPDGKIGHSTKNSSLLIKVACEVALSKREKMYVYGNDYPTKDGTGIRDYIHVSDLAQAHLNALTYLRNGGDSTTLNCGYGHGYSVREVLDAFTRIHGSPLNVEDTSRREGDIPALVAEAGRIRELLDWTPQYDDLDFIVKTSLDWEKKL